MLRSNIIAKNVQNSKAISLFLIVQRADNQVKLMTSLFRVQFWAFPIAIRQKNDTFGILRQNCKGQAISQHTMTRSPKGMVWKYANNPYWQQRSIICLVVFMHYQATAHQFRDILCNAMHASHITVSIKHFNKLNIVFFRSRKRLDPYWSVYKQYHVAVHRIDDNGPVLLTPTSGFVVTGAWLMGSN